MNVGQLKKIIEGVDDNMLVLIPFTMKFDGMFYSPCVKDSGISTLGTGDFDKEDIEEMELLNKEIPEEDSFVLVPHNFYEQGDINYELN